MPINLSDSIAAARGRYLRLNDAEYIITRRTPIKSDFLLDCAGAFIRNAVPPGEPGLDLTGSNNVKIFNGFVHPQSSGACFILMARQIDNKSAGGHVIEDIVIDGNFSVASIVCAASETNRINCRTIANHANAPSLWIGNEKPVGLNGSLGRSTMQCLQFSGALMSWGGSPALVIQPAAGQKVSDLHFDGGIGVCANTRAAVQFKLDMATPAGGECLNISFDRWRVEAQETADYIIEATGMGWLHGLDVSRSQLIARKHLFYGPRCGLRFSSFGGGWVADQFQPRTAAIVAMDYQTTDAAKLEGYFDNLNPISHPAVDGGGVA
jgi:hypothetical protein